MSETGTATFINPDDYCAGIGEAKVTFVLTGRGPFRARLTWLKTRDLRVVFGRESTARIAYMSLRPGRTFALFPLKSEVAPIWSGVALRPGDIVFHSLGERAHQWTKGASQWGLVSLSPELLAAYGKALNELELTPPPVGRVLRPPRTAAVNLRRLLSSACRVAETKPEVFAQEKAARALEQELMYALVTCLAANDVQRSLATNRGHAQIMLRFEEALAAHVGLWPSIPKLCAAIDVSARTLRTCCAEFLGLSPSQYLGLRRLNMVRAELFLADPTTASVEDIARRYQFLDFRQFIVTYQNAFGETPSATLRQATIKLG
jgi:AraC-like DNA-binding protein